MGPHPCLRPICLSSIVREAFSAPTGEEGKGIDLPVTALLLRALWLRRHQCGHRDTGDHNRTTSVRRVRVIAGPMALLTCNLCASIGKHNGSSESGA